MKLGDKVKDSITGIEGIAIARDEWINGCVRVGVQPKAKKGEAVAPDMVWVDIEQIIILKTAKPKKKEPTGGPRPTPMHPPDPKRF